MRNLGPKKLYICREKNTLLKFQIHLSVNSNTDTVVQFVNFIAVWSQCYEK